MTLHKAFAITSCLSLLIFTGCPGDDDNNISPENNEENNSINNSTMSNKAPIANPGENFDTVVGMRTEVTAAASSDPEGGILTVQWTMEPPAGSSATLDKPTAFRTGFVPDVEGIYKLTLVVNDGKLDSAAVPVYVRAVKKMGGEMNTAPVASAGEDATYFLDQTIFMDGSASSDPEGDALTYAWRITQSPSGSSATLSSSDIAKPELLADLPGLYEMELIVNDGELDSPPDTVLLTLKDVTTSNTPPVAAAVVPGNVLIDQMVTFDASSSMDADGDALSYSWTLLGAPMNSAATIVDETLPMASFTADLVGDYSFELVVNDGIENSAPLAFQVVATAVANTPPVAVTPTPLFTLPGQPLALDGSQSFDDDGNPLTYRWRLMQKPVGSVILLANANAMVASITPDVAGSYSVELVVNDGIENSAPVTVAITAAERPDTCLIISEYIEGTGNNKALELYNCGDKVIDLAGKHVCLVRDGNTPTCSSPMALTGSLGIGEVIGVCHSLFNMSQLDAGDCDFTNNTTMTFNGDDRLIVFEDVNTMNGVYDVGDVVLDAFGETSKNPSGREWEDTTYRRCNFLPYDGVSMPFDVTAFYDDFFADDYSDFGLPPAPGVVCGAAPVNRAPVANAGTARTRTTGQTITLDGSASSDPDNDALTYLWTMTQQPVGSTAMLDDPTLVAPSFVADLDGMYTFSLVVNDSALDSNISTVTITTLPPVTPGSGCLIISEYIEGSGNNKALEFYNCGANSMSLDDINVCIISNNSMACTPQTTLQLTGQLAAGDVLGVCNTMTATNLGMVTGACSIKSAVINFNGNDRVLLYRDTNNTGTFISAEDEILDAFGKTTFEPASEIWKDRAYRRCNLTRYDGLTDFIITDYYTVVMGVDDFSGLGVAPDPSAVCP